MLRTRIARRCALAVTAAALAVFGTAAGAYADEPADAESPTPTVSPSPTPTVSPSPTENPTPTPVDELPEPPDNPAATLPETPPLEADIEARSECWTLVEVLPGVHEYVNICESPGDDDDGDDGEWVGPSCDLSHEPYDEFCWDERACYADIPSPIAEENWPEEGQKTEDHIFTTYACFLPPDGKPEARIGWINPYYNSLPEQGWAAWGKLQTPAFTLGFQPAEVSYVGADTTFEIDGIGDGELVGTKAGPLQAFGSFSHVELDTGDGSDRLHCDNAPETDDCAHVYLKTSHAEPAADLDGRAAFHAQARLVYDVTYLMNGEPITLPGVPNVLESPWNGILVPVGEIQTLVQ